MGISRQTIEEIRTKANIVEIIRAYVGDQATTLTEKGGHTSCPFHKEKTASFYVNPAIQTYHCFGCGEHGDVFKFLMRHNGLNFQEAAAQLAQRYGTRVEYNRSTRRASPKGIEAMTSGDLKEGDAKPGNERQDQSRRELLYSALGRASEIYVNELWSDGGRDARKYLLDRKLSEETMKREDLGLLPYSGQWQFLLSRLSQDFPKDILIEAGLVQEKEGKVFDQINGPRVMFPVRDMSNRVVGFSGRTLNKDEKGRKYINTPDTQLFRKGNLLLGIPSALPAIRKAKRAVVVEGQMDRIMPSQDGVGYVVAPMGTALTLNQIKLLRSSAPNAKIDFLFDPDPAGRKAALRAAGMVIGKADAHVSFCPEGQDPAKIHENGDTILNYISGGAKSTSLPVSTFYFREIFGNEKPSLESCLRVLGDPVIKDVFWKVPYENRGMVVESLAQHTGFSSGALDIAIFGKGSLPRGTRERAEWEFVSNLLGSSKETIAHFIPQAKHILSPPSLAILDFFNNQEATFYDCFGEDLFGKSAQQYANDVLLGYGEEIDFVKHKDTVAGIVSDGMATRRRGGVTQDRLNRQLAQLELYMLGRDIERGRGNATTVLHKIRSIHG